MATITGSPGNDLLTGSAQDDSISGLAGNDTLRGLDGNDTLDGGTGNDSLDGATGNDTYLATVGDVLTDAGGIDTVQVDGNWTLAAGFENLTLLGTGNWQAQGNNDANVILGNGGANYINSRAGDDTIHAGAGNDSIDISTGSTSTYGNKVIDGGDGVDTIDIDGYARSAIIVNLASGTMSGGGDAGAGSATLISIEKVVGGGFNDHIVGDAAANIFDGRLGNDTIEGAGGTDSIWGGGGADAFAFAESGAANADWILDFTSNSDSIHLDAGAFTNLGATGRFAAGDVRFYAAAGATGGHDADDRVILNTSTGQLFYDADGSGSGAAQLITKITGSVIATDIYVDAASSPSSGESIMGGFGFDSLEGGPGNDTIDGSDGMDTLDGAGGNDLLIDTGTDNTNPNTDSMLGGDGDDTLRGAANAYDTMNGGPGNDQLDGSASADEFLFNVAPGAANADVIIGFSGGFEAIVLDAAAMPGIGPSGTFGNTDPRFFAAPGANAGHDTDDRIVYNTTTGQLWYDADGSGTTAAQLIATLQGAPTLTTANLFVINDGGTGFTLNGTAGDDSIRGTDGTDTINGLGGNDTLDGSGGADRLDGGSGNDSLHGGPHPFDGDGADTLIGGDGNDTLDGESSAFANQDPVAEVLDGGLGDDKFVVDNSGDLLVDAGGIDTVLAINTSWTLAADFENLIINNGEVESAVRGTGNSLDNILDGRSGMVLENGAGGWHVQLFGLAGNDTLLGSSQEDTLSGGDGDDSINGFEDYDSIDGGAGNDTLDGGSSEDTLTGGAGADLFGYSTGGTLSITTDQIADFAPGTDKLQFDGNVFLGTGPSGNLAAGDGRFYAAAGATGGHDADDRFVYDTTTGNVYYDQDGWNSSVGQLIFTLQGAPALAATDIVVVNGSSNDQTLTGTSGNDTLIGGIGNDTIDGLGGNDSINGGDGGADSLIGGDGDDTMWSAFGASHDDAASTMSGGLGNDEYNVDDFGGGDAILADPGGIDTVIAWNVGTWTLGAGLDNLTIGDTRGIGATAIGNELNNDIQGPSEGSTLFGLAGNDTLTGSQFNGSYLVGGPGQDVLNGEHNTTYAFDVAPGAANADAITFFDVNFDTIELDGNAMSAIGPSGRFATDDARFYAAAGASGGHDSNDRVVYDTSSGRLWYDADGSGSSAAQLIATLQNAPALAASSLTVVNGTGPGLVINGTAGNDTLTGTSGDDSISGLGGNDSLDGAFGKDTLDGGTGNDYLRGGAETDPGVSDGADVLVGGDGDDTLDGWSNDGRTRPDNSVETLNGGLGNDQFNVDNPGDVLSDAGGVDVVEVRTGGWTLGAGFENLVVFDQEDGTDEGIGNSLDNVMESRAWEAHLEGMGGNDLLFVYANGGRTQILNGGDGNDTLLGSAGTQFTTLNGDAGNDSLAGAGSSTMTGGAGADIFAAHTNAQHWLTDFLSGTDTLQFDGSDFAGTGPSGNLAAGDPRFYAAAGATGGHDADDRFVYNTSTGDLYYDSDGFGGAGGSLVAHLQGAPALAATDITVVNGTAPVTGQAITGTAGNDSLSGGPGNDTLNGLGGADTMNGQLGDDSYVVTAGDALSDPGGIDTVQSDGNWTLGAGFENLTLLGTGNWQGQGNNDANVIVGNGSANYINSRAGDDTIQGGGGNDSIDISTGSTSTYGSKSIDGGTGFDTIDIDGYAHSAIIVDLTAGTMTGGGDAGTGSATLISIEKVVGGGFNDRITGDGVSNIFDGRLGNDTINGMGGNDTIWGGGGTDSFLFSQSGTANADRLVDFASGTDSLLFDHNAFTALGPVSDWNAGDARFYAAAGATAGHDADDRLVYNTSTGNLYYDDDGSGSHTAQLVATLNAGAALAASDISVT